MRREHHVAVRAAAIEYNRELRRASEALRAASRRLCAISKETPESSAAIQERCRGMEAQAVAAETSNRRAHMSSLLRLMRGVAPGGISAALPHVT